MDRRKVEVVNFVYGGGCCAELPVEKRCSLSCKHCIVYFIGKASGVCGKLCSGGGEVN